MTKPSRLRLSLAAGAALVAAAAALALFAGTARAADAKDGAKIDRPMKVVVADPAFDGDTIDLADYDAMTVGERRHFETDSGKSIEVEKTKRGLRLEVEGKTIEVATPALDEDLPTKVRISGGDGESNLVWVGADAPRKVMVLRHVDKDGGSEESSFAYRIGDGRLPLVAPIEAIASRLEKSAKFQELDAASRAKVLEALRELDLGPSDDLDEGHALVLKLGGDGGSDDPR